MNNEIKYKLELPKGEYYFYDRKEKQIRKETIHGIKVDAIFSEPDSFYSMSKSFEITYQLGDYSQWWVSEDELFATKKECEKYVLKLFT